MYVRKSFFKCHKLKNITFNKFLNLFSSGNNSSNRSPFDPDFKLKMTFWIILMCLTKNSNFLCTIVFSRNMRN